MPAQGGAEVLSAARSEVEPFKLRQLDKIWLSSEHIANLSFMCAICMGLVADPAQTLCHHTF